MTTRQLAIGLALLALLPRLYLMGNQSLWIDEAYSLEQLRLPWSALVTPGGYEEIHPPVFYLTVKPLSGLVPPSSEWFEWWLRLPSAVFSALGTLAVFWLGMLLFDRATGAVAGLFYAISAFSIWYGQELRMYSLALMLVTLQVGLAIRAVSRPSSVRHWLLLFLVGTAASLTHWYSVFAWPALLVYLYWARPSRASGVRLGVVVLGVALATCAYLVPKIIGGRTEMVGSAGWRNLAFTLWSFWSGYSVGPSVVDLHTDPLDKVGRFFPSVATLAGLALVTSAMSAWALWRQRTPRLLFLLGWLVVGLVGPFLLAVLTGRTFNARYSFVAFPAMILLLGSGAVQLRSPWARGVFLGAYLASQLWPISNYYWDPYYWREDFRSVATALREDPRARGSALFSYATRDALAAYGIEGWEWRAYPHWEPWSEELRQAIDERLGSGGGIWLVTGRRWWDSERRIRDHLGQRSESTGHRQWVGLDLWTFRPQGPPSPP